MKVIWGKEKNERLFAQRELRFQPFAKLIKAKKYLAKIKNPARNNQWVFVVPYQGYTYAVPFVIDKNDNVVLKTVYPSRKYHKEYGKNQTEER